MRRGHNMKPYVISFCIALAITCLFGGTRNPQYMATGIENVTTKNAINAKRDDGGIGELNYVDVARPYKAAVAVKDNST